MKKTAFWLLMLLICLLAGTACASIDKVGEEVCYSYSYSGSYPDVYFFMEVINNGSEPADLSSDSKFAIYDKDGTEIESTSLELLPMVLQPGETGYVFCDLSTSLSDSSSISSYKYTLEADTPYWNVYLYKGEAVKEEDEIYVRITNNDSATLWDTYGYIVLKDSAGRPVYINTTIAYQIGIPSGQCLDFPMFIGADLQEFLAQNGMEPVSYAAGGYTFD